MPSGALAKKEQTAELSTAAVRVAKVCMRSAFIAVILYVVFSACALCFPRSLVTRIYALEIRPVNADLRNGK
jgi:hypothetical protein